MEKQKRNTRKIKLERHGGCKDCNRTCVHNGAVCIPDVAQRTINTIFRCNNTHPNYGKDSEVFV